MSPASSSESSGDLTVLTAWIVGRRWYTGKHGSPRLREIGSWVFPDEHDDAEDDAGGSVRIRTRLLLDEGSTPHTLYQVPVTERRTPLPGADAALIAVVPGPSGGERYLYDGPHDPAYAMRMLRLIVQGGAATGAGASARGVCVFPLDVAGADIAARVLQGEQSNTSIVYEPRDAEGAKAGSVICKIFRTLQPGENPDVALPTALYAAGSRSVPRPIGSVEGRWDDPGGAGQATGHFAIAQEFLTGSHDGWQLALEAAESGHDFAEHALSLGIATADMHAGLASAFPTRATDATDIAATLATWRLRLDTAVDEVPALAPLRETIDELYATAAAVPWPRQQRIHGDLHLGQVLSAPHGRWVVIDFEGEPLRPLAERSRLDVALRDVAGMLRSFDYVTGARPTAARVGERARASRQAFLTGYAERSGEDARAHRILLDAFEADKALYEAVYEVRNRPDWLPIPTAALRRLAVNETRFL